MNREPARKAADKLYARVISQVIRAIGQYMGLAVSDKVLRDIAKSTHPIITASRRTIQNIAYQDYKSVAQGKDLVPKLELNRFTPDLWQGVVNKAAENYAHVTKAVAEEIGMQADRWTRDSEWGTRLNITSQDPRFGWARVDFEPPTCPWCTVMNSRGPVYRSAESGANTLHNGDTCTLILVPVGAKDYVGKNHTDEAERRYKRATQAVGTKPEDVFKYLRDENTANNKPQGRVKTDAQNAVESAAQSELKTVRSRIQALERMNPKSDSAKKLRDEQLSANQTRLNLLESGTP